MSNTTIGAQAPHILALDAGTSSYRAILYDAWARPLPGAAGQERYAPAVGADGAIEDDPEEALGRLARCIDAALAAAPPGPIAAVGGATLASTFLALDAAGRPLTPLILYSDTRATSDSEALRERLSEREAHERTGCLLRASYWPARLAWLRRARPEVWAAAARFVTLGEYIELRWRGVARVSASAAAWTGLLDRRALAWDGPLLAELGVAPGALAPVAAGLEPQVGLRPELAARWPTLAGAAWLPPVGDGAAANIGSGCAGPGRLALTVGTTAAVRAVLPSVDAVPDGLWCYCVDGRRALLGGATSEGGNLFAWLRASLRLPEPAALEAELAALPPDGHGLTVLPFIAGERSPGWAGDARATFHGVSLETTPVELVRAALEAVALRLALVADALPPAAEGEVVASGGALLSSPAWLQICADALGRPIVASAEEEASARGAALLALEAIGRIPDAGALPAALGATYAPRPAVAAVYRRALARQRRLYNLLVAGR